jgi:glycerate kinase
VGLRMHEHRALRILVACDKFKDSLDGEGVIAAVASGLDAGLPDRQLQIESLCMSDGGEGFLAALRAPMALEIRSLSVIGPLGLPIMAEYGVCNEFDAESASTTTTAVIEMARASGIELVPVGSRNPLHTTSHGTGQLIRHAIDSGCTRILLGVGGSATSDGTSGASGLVAAIDADHGHRHDIGGLGALGSLGVTFDFDQQQSSELDTLLQQAPLPPGQADAFYGRDLARVRAIHVPDGMIPQGVSIDVACDVTNPFIGPTGAVRVFAPQKGATPQIQTLLEQGMCRVADLLNGVSHCSIHSLSGAGAAGMCSNAVRRFATVVCVRVVDTCACCRWNSRQLSCSPKRPIDTSTSAHCFLQQHSQACLCLSCVLMLPAVCATGNRADSRSIPTRQANCPQRCDHHR